MSYATQQDMIDRFGTPKLVQLTDIEEPMAGMISSTVLAAKLADADAVIDGYLAGRYALPMTVFPAILKVHACSIAYYMLLGSGADEIAQRDHKLALDYLTRVAAGDIALLPPSQAEVPAGDGPVVFSTGSKVMGRDAYGLDG